MSEGLHPESVLKSLKKGVLAPFYLFHGSNEFLLEKTLHRIREDFIPESARDFNVEIFYGGKDSLRDHPEDILSHAHSFPFLATNRLIIVRRVEEFNAEELDAFLPYLKRPTESTCLIFVCPKPDFRRSFFKTIKSLGFAVAFDELREGQIVPWIKRSAKDMGMDLDSETCLYLREVVGSRLGDLYGELEKLSLSYGKEIGTVQVKELAVHSRIYSIFELTEAVSSKNAREALGVLKRFLEEEDKREGPLQVLRMLNRQLRFLFLAKAVLKKGGGVRELGAWMGKSSFKAQDYINQSRSWSPMELKKGFALLLAADRSLKSGASRPRTVVENVILTLCN